MEERPNAQDMANKAEREAAYLDEWRYEQAVAVTGEADGLIAFYEYRRLVREDARP